MLEMYMRLERLQQEQQQLLGTLEEQGHTIEGLKRRQRELYLDIDRRLTRLEKDGGAGTGGFTPEPASSGNGCQSIAPGGCEAPDAIPPRTEQGSPAQAGDSAREREHYQQAFNLLRELNYAQAISGFREFLQAYPEGVYAHMAQYWLGEANYTQRQFKSAISDYQHLIDSYPQSPKLAEAMLKIGYSQEELGNKAAAMETLAALEKRFPGSTEAGQARKLLLRLRSQP
jgi:tol-pal system protein YbgF